MSELKGVERSSDKKIRLLFVFCGALLLILIVLGVIFFGMMRRDKTGNSYAESERIIRRVSELYLVPTSETPTVAEVKDKSSLPQTQDFYKGAENGDFLLVYNKTKIAILYRESINKLIKVTPVVPTASPTDQTGKGNETR